MRAHLLISLVLACGCGRESPPEPAGGPCTYTEVKTTCDLASDELRIVEDEGNVVVTARYGDGPVHVAEETFEVPVDQREALLAHLARHASVPCSYQQLTSGTCVPMSGVRIEVPAFPPD